MKTVENIKLKESLSSTLINFLEKKYVNKRIFFDYLKK